jgi:hypothetical protein
MFELRPSIPDEEIVARARSARAAGRACFQIFAPHVGERSEEEAEFEAARLVDLLEAERWTLENAAFAAEQDGRSPYEWGAYGFLSVPAVVGTIYTFRLSEAA